MLTPLAAILSRRALLLNVAAAPALAGIQASLRNRTEQPIPADWQCPMDPDIHLSQPGKCPRCGMTLVLKISERAEYYVELTVEPSVIQPGAEVLLTLRIVTPEGKPASHFDLVHEKLLHLFVVSENLEFFEHVHPELQSDSTFRLRTRLPNPGMYRLLADYYPTGSVPQLSPCTLYVEGRSQPPSLKPVLSPQQGPNLTANLRMEPEDPVAGMLCRLFFELTPRDGLELYLGAWAHMLIASSDLVDMIHSHPFLVSSSAIQFNIIFPRAGMNRVWTQFQRLGVVNTVVFTVPVRGI